MTYFNCNVHCTDGRIIKYHNVTQPHAFVEYCKRNLPVRVVMFYCKRHYRDKLGSYCGFWSLKKGMTLQSF